jgi:hypothetical protein
LKDSPLKLALAAVVSLAGCQSANEILDDQSGIASQTALSRGRFELSCPDAQASLLSRSLINPAINGPTYGGVQRTEYTIGISGCGKKASYITVCQVGAVGCIAGEGRLPEGQP